MRTREVIGVMGVGLGLVGGALAGLGSDGGFDMFIHFPGFFVAPRTATTNLQVRPLPPHFSSSPCRLSSPIYTCAKS
jgi:hypothetical protein